MTLNRAARTRRSLGPAVEPQFELRPSIIVGDSADVYLHRTLTILRNEQINPVVVMEFFPARSGVLCGIKEVKLLLEKVLPQGSHEECLALQEGDRVEGKEVALRIKAPYTAFALYETAICGTLSQCTGWATAAREAVEAAGNIPVISFGARHVHPNVAHLLDYAAIVGGCVSCSTVLGAKLAGMTPSGTMPHALVLCVGDTIKAMELFHKHMPSDVPRIALVDTLRDEVEESLAVASALKGKLRGVLLDTPIERGGVTPELVKEVRAHLDQTGFQGLEIMVSGGIDIARIRQFVESGAPVDVFGVGHQISSAPPNDFTADIHEVDGKPFAKRGRIPGVTNNSRLQPLF